MLWHMLVWSYIVIKSIHWLEEKKGRKKSQECGFQAVFLKANDLYKWGPQS